MDDDIEYSKENAPVSADEIREFDSTFGVDSNTQEVVLAFRPPHEEAHALLFVMPVDHAEQYAMKLLDAVKTCREQKVQ